MKRGAYTAIIFLIALIISYDALPNEFGDQSSSAIDLQKASYPELGITTAGINLGYWFNRYGFRLSQYYLNNTHNRMTFNIGYKLSDNEKTQKSINILAGKYMGSDPGADYDYAYAGIAYGLNFSILGFHGLFLEIGIAKVLEDNLGNLDDDPFVPCGHFGYIHRLISKKNK